MEDLLSNVDWTEIGWASWDTLVMVGMSLLFSVLIGLPIGVLLFLFGKRQLLEQPVAYAVLSFVVNVLRSVPFIILLIVMIPFTVMLIGTSLGASVKQIIFGALLPEALPGIIAGITVTAITLVSYAAMSGVIGGGGLGDLAIRFGYQRFQTDVMVITVALLVIFVQVLQMVGDRLVLYFSRK